MHQHKNSDLNVIKDILPKLYAMIKKYSELCPRIPFELAESIDDCMVWHDTPQGRRFWQELHDVCWDRDKEYYFDFFIHAYNDLCVEDLTDVFNKGVRLFTNKYNLTYDVKTGIAADSDACGVDFTTKRRLCDY